MSFQKYKSNSFCVGGRHRSSTTKIYGDLSSKGSKILIGFCSIFTRKKSMTVSDNSRQAEGLGSYFKILGEISSKAEKN